MPRQKTAAKRSQRRRTPSEKPRARHRKARKRKMQATSSSLRKGKVTVHGIRRGKKNRNGSQLLRQQVTEKQRRHVGKNRGAPALYVTVKNGQFCIKEKSTQSKQTRKKRRVG